MKLDECLIKDKDGKGKIVLEEISVRKKKNVIDATGEIAVNENAALHVNPRISETSGDGCTWRNGHITDSYNAYSTGCLSDYR